MKNKTKFVILGLLTEGPLSGYDLKNIIDVRFRYFWSESYGQIYPQIKKMLATGEIEKEFTPTDSRKKQLYRITQKGYISLSSWMALPVEKETVRLEILLKIYFSGFMDNTTLTNHLVSFKQQHELELKQIKGFQKELESIPNPHNNHQNILNVIDFGIITNQAYLEWCNTMLNEMEETK